MIHSANFHLNDSELLKVTFDDSTEQFDCSIIKQIAVKKSVEKKETPKVEKVEKVETPTENKKDNLLEELNS